MNLRSAISAINKAGALLVFPIQNRHEPASLWAHFFPKSKMVWEWDQDSDHRVADLWHLRERLSSSGKIVYTKWFQGRATLFRKDLLPYLIRVTNPQFPDLDLISNEAHDMLKILLDNSPLSTKALKQETGLQGKFFEADYQRRLKELWRRFLIVGSGEIDDGAFPSLAISATKNFFEEEWKAAATVSEAESIDHLRTTLGPDSPFLKQLAKMWSRDQDLSDRSATH